MRHITVPALHCPFEAKISPFVHEIDRHTASWLQEFNLLQTDEAYDRFRRYKFAWMTARTYPDADLAFLCTANDLNTWLFVLDDLLDHVTPDTAGYREKGYLQQVITDFVRVLRYDQSVDRSVNPVLAALSDFWNNMRPLSSVSWQCQFTLSLKATFEAAVWEAENAKLRRHPSVFQYMQMRPFFSGANLGTDMLEVAAGTYLPVFVLQNEQFQKLVDLARRAVCWANDLFSLSKELAHGDEHNLVVVIGHEQQITLEEAIAQTAAIHNQEIAMFNQLRTQLPSFGLPIDSAIQRHVDALGTMVRGFMDWSIYDTARYHFDYTAS
ncbi:terpene synthase family protein [Chitinophaga rhizophila]|uniref:Terpene synthase n=1 Tax=Chitinophaga rhizophila TaxID=2866212 RepID=A0ABS7GJK2_9BACT|nr:hypothetical protein [Chitinophaga rhizophila]MBW8686939.1 hypothetical protein [Chitinophaga rhizophila]